MSERVEYMNHGSVAAAGAGSKAAGILCALLVVALFSGFTLVSRLGFSSNLSLANIAALRFGIGGILLLPVLLKFGIPELKAIQLIALCIFGGVGFALLAYAGFYLAPASHGAVLLHGTLPLFTFTIIYFADHPKVYRLQVIGLATIAFGVVVMIWDSLIGATLMQLAGDSALLLASIFWSAYGVMVKRLKIAPAHAASVVAVFSMCCFFPLYILYPGESLLSVDWHELVIQGIFQGVLLGVVSIFVYTRAVSILGAAETALFTTAVPCITTICAIPLLAEWPSTSVVVGVIAVTMGMTVAMISRH